jgi:hypothetical protein
LVFRGGCAQFLRNSSGILALHRQTPLCADLTPFGDGVLISLFIWEIAMDEAYIFVRNLIGCTLFMSAGAKLGHSAPRERRSAAE